MKIITNTKNMIDPADKIKSMVSAGKKSSPDFFYERL